MQWMMFQILAEADTQGAVWSFGSIITALIGLLSWYIKSAQDRNARDNEKMRAALDDCTHAHIIMGIELAHLIPGAKERLEAIKTRIEQRLAEDKR